MGFKGTAGCLWVGATKGQHSVVPFGITFQQGWGRGRHCISGYKLNNVLLWEEGENERVWGTTPPGERGMSFRGTLWEGGGDSWMRGREWEDWGRLSLSH